MITSAHIYNFRGLTEIAFDNLTGRLFLTGLNGAGKTSFLNAVQVAFTGVCSDQLGKRIQNPALIGPNGKEASIVFGLALDDGPAELEVHITAKQQSCRVTCNGRDLIAGSPAEVRAALWKRMGGDVALADAGLHSRQYLLGDSIIQHIAKLSGGIKREQLTDACGEHWPWVLNFTQARRLALDTPEALGKIGEAAYMARTETNRTAKTLKTQIDQGSIDLPSGPTRAFTPDDLPVLRENLTELRSERDRLLRELGAASGAHTQEEIDAGLQQAEIELANLAIPDVSVEQLVAERNRMSGIHGKEQAALNGLLERRERLTREIAATETSGSCPTCKRPFKAAEIAKIVAPLDAELKQVNALCAEKPEYVQSLLDSLGPIDERIRAAREEVQNYDSARRRLEAQITAFKSYKPRIDSSGIQGEIDTLDARIARGEDIIGKLVAYQSVERLREQLATTDAEIEQLNWAVAAFRDGEVSNKLTSDGRDQFLAAINERLEAFGLVLWFQGTGADTAVYYSRRGKPRTMAEASDGELLVCQLAIAEAFGQGMIVLDRLDALDGEWKIEVLSRINALGGDCILAGAWGMAGQPVSQGLIDFIAPASVAWIANGGGYIIAGAE